ncbi:TonB-dependent receptor [uncultured Sphingomonas sp.]|uniref:TonB-dependent receptor n=1 Tax=uncultured Sphingomonas sp. TaxID=158754 RepID=UPI0035C9C019
MATPAMAQETPAAPPSPGNATTPGAPDTAPSTGKDIVVTARRLDDARAHIQPSLGATSYTVTNATIQALPGGDDQQFNQIILQLPGVVQDGFGQFHVRDDHNGLQYRINGTVLPDGLAVFGQTLSPRLIEKFSLLTGALPAQYGLRSAGIIDITTKSGFDNGGSISIYGGSHGTIEPSFSLGGSTGATNYFVSGDFRHDALGIESVDGRSNPIHDKTDQYQGFLYVDHILNESNRASLVGGYSNQSFQIPNPGGQHPTAGYHVGGVTDFLSDDLNERQIEQTGFVQVSLLHDAEPLTIQGSLFARYSSLRYRPDIVGELLFNGQAQEAFKQDFTVGVQADAVYHAGKAHMLRGGLLVTRDRSVGTTSTSVFPVDDAGAQIGQPIIIPDNSRKTAMSYSVYLQDEWSFAPTLTLNYGGRFDVFDGYRDEKQFSPRANLVWQPDDKLTAHIGYARYFVPPPFELVGNSSIAKFIMPLTSAAPQVTDNTTPFAERQNYYDVGFQYKLSRYFTYGVDAYYRQSVNLIDEGQFGAPIILTPFNYANGRIGGVEANASYTRGGWLVYANFAAAKAKGSDIVSSQFSFDPGDLAYIANRYIYLDHDQTFTGSAGVSYAFKHGLLADTKLGGSMIYGSGLRADGAVPNGAKLDGYAQFNLTASHRFAKPGLTVRFDVINVGDHVYEIRDGSGVGVGAPQFGPRRGFFVGLSKAFGAGSADVS